MPDTVVATATNAPPPPSLVTDNGTLVPSAAPPLQKVSIGGTPPKATQDSYFEFTPTVTGATSPVSFSASGIPSWAKFNEHTGTLYGTPPNAGTFKNIAISALVAPVDDLPAANLSLKAFDLVVVAAPIPTMEQAFFSLLAKEFDHNNDSLKAARRYYDDQVRKLKTAKPSTP